jgi:hypothetical protein
MATVTTPKQVYISKPSQETNFTSDYSLTSQSVIMYGNESTLTTTMEITLPHYSVVGNIISYKLFNQQPSDNGVNMIVKAPTLNNVQMIFKGTSPQIINSTTLALAPNSTATVFIVKNNYSVMYNNYFTQTTSPPIIKCAANHNSTTPCCGQPGGTVNSDYVCPQDRPICKDYIYDVKWGNCESTSNTSSSTTTSNTSSSTTTSNTSSSTTTSNTSSSTTTSNSEQQAQQQAQQEAQQQAQQDTNFLEDIV